MNTGATNDRTYHGLRGPDGICHVTVAVASAILGRPLPPRLDLLNKSPTGFEWGYDGSGPAQLALALCADALGGSSKGSAGASRWNAAGGDDAAALRLFQLFKSHVVSRLPRDEPWTLTSAEVRQQCRDLQTDPPGGTP